MDTCPPELHSYIAYLACLADHGPTIRSLSLVSRYFHEIAGPYLYHTISVSGLKDIVTLAQKLQNLPTTHLANIRHLFVSNSDGATNPRAPESIHRILQLCAPSLLSLTVDSTRSLSQSTLLFSRLFRVHFPRLQELTLAGFYPFPNSSFGSLSPKFPALEQLHLHGNRNPHGLLQMNNLSGACPNLTHLRISGLSMAVSFALELEEALHAPRTPSSMAKKTLPGAETVMDDPFSVSFSAPPSRLPNSIRHVVVEPASELQALPAHPLPSNMALLKDRAMMDRLQAIVPSSQSKVLSDGGYAHGEVNGIQFTLLERPAADLSSGWFQERWLERRGESGI